MKKWVIHSILAGWCGIAAYSFAAEYGAVRSATLNDANDGDAYKLVVAKIDGESMAGVVVEFDEYMSDIFQAIDKKFGELSATDEIVVCRWAISSFVRGVKTPLKRNEMKSGSPTAVDLYTAATRVDTNRVVSSGYAILGYYFSRFETLTNRQKCCVVQSLFFDCANNKLMDDAVSDVARSQIGCVFNDENESKMVRLTALRFISVSAISDLMEKVAPLIQPDGADDEYVANAKKLILERITFDADAREKYRSISGAGPLR